MKTDEKIETFEGSVEELSKAWDDLVDVLLLEPPLSYVVRLVEAVEDWIETRRSR